MTNLCHYVDYFLEIASGKMINNVSLYHETGSTDALINLRDSFCKSI